MQDCEIQQIEQEARHRIGGAPAQVYVSAQKNVYAPPARLRDSGPEQHIAPGQQESEPITCDGGFESAFVAFYDLTCDDLCQFSLRPLQISQRSNSNNDASAAPMAE
jgi:hypothetical protein